MSGFGFSLPDLTSGLSSLSEIGERFSKIKEEIESSIDATLYGEAEQEPIQGVHVGVF